MLCVAMVNPESDRRRRSENTRRCKSTEVTEEGGEEIGDT